VPDKVKSRRRIPSSPARKTKLGDRSEEIPIPLDWNFIADYACTLPRAAPARHYGKPAVKVDGRAILGPSREEGSFVLHIDADTKQILMETDPETFWESPHYKGWPCVLVRYDTTDPGRVLEMVRRSGEWARARGPRPARAPSRASKTLKRGS
jgi:hypothetical protein